MTRSQHAPTDTIGFSDNVIGGLGKVAADTHEKWMADFMGGPPGTRKTEKSEPSSRPQRECAPDSSEFDVRFKYLSDSQVEDLTKSENFNDASDAHKELINRADRLDPIQLEKTISKIDAMSKALKLGRELVEDPDGTYGIDFSKPLSEEKRWLLHVAITMNIEKLSNQVERRMNFASFLSENRHFDEAFDLGQSAIDAATRFLKPIDIGGKQVTLLDLIDDESHQLILDQNDITDPSRRVAMQQVSMFLKGKDSNSGIMHLPERALSNLLEIDKRNRGFTKMPEKLLSANF